MCESLLAFLRICDNFAFLRDVFPCLALPMVGNMDLWKLKNVNGRELVLLYWGHRLIAMTLHQRRLYKIHILLL